MGRTKNWENESGAALDRSPPLDGARRHVRPSQPAGPTAPYNRGPATRRPRSRRAPTRHEMLSGLSIAIVVVAMLPMRIPFPIGVLVMTPIAIGVANPAAWPAVNFILTIF